MKNLIKTKWFIYGTYLLLVLATLLIGFVLLQNNKTLKNVIISFFEVAENRTFDYRQSLQVIHKRPLPNKDIVVLAVDDASLESLWEKYGEWPIPRNVYADLINYLELQKPQSIIFDLMFIKSIRATADADKYLAETMNKYNNIYTAMNLDDHPSSLRLPIDLPERLALNIQNDSNVDFTQKSYKNCRPIMSSLIDGKVNIGMTNVQRASDGILREITPIMMYKDKYYPYLSFKAGADYIEQKNAKDFVIDANSNLKVFDTKIPLTKDGNAILNWYGPSGTHTIIPMYEVINAMTGTNKSLNTKFDFKDKVIIIGTTATALQDNKSVPIQNIIYPGVEVHATFFNNMLDNNFIRKTDAFTDIIIITSVIAIVGAIVMLSTSTLFASLSTILFGIAYLFISYYLMELYNLWIPVVMPVISIMAAFALSFLAKYLLKARDFEYQYKLATIDGLTELYNHRYFQDTLRKQIDIARRYNQAFSLIIIDIDFFKKFNDTYGHQAGDAVLRQVAKILKNNSRATDYVCRYGGEEMTIILPNTSAEDALFNANRICKAVAETPFHLTPVDKVNVTISLGVSTFPDNAQTPQDLIEWADKGLYYAKEHGRNQVGRY
ncbi:diguanylate cyclase [bacterium]|nr:diguanylate cyclase [bacterium]